MEALVRQWDPFLSTNLAADDPYDLADHIINAHRRDVEITAMFDRNLISCLAHLASGRPIPTDAGSSETYRVAAGCMAYFILGKTMVDPSIAMHELGDDASLAEVHRQIRLFRIADHVHPRDYTNIAVGHAGRISPEALETAENFVDQRWPRLERPSFPQKLRGTTKHQSSLTKIALLERGSGARRQKMQKYFQWCLDDAYFDAAAATFAIIYFGQNRSSGMLKGINSSRYETCAAGIRNATWDLLYVDHWAKDARREDPGIARLFCTRDRALLEIGRCMVAPRFKIDARTAQTRVLKRHWPQRDAEGILRHYDELMAEIRRDPAKRRQEMAARRPPDLLLRELDEELKGHFKE